MMQQYALIKIFVRTDSIKYPPDMASLNLLIFYINKWNGISLPRNSTIQCNQPQPTSGLARGACSNFEEGKGHRGKVKRTNRVYLKISPGVDRDDRLVRASSICRIADQVHDVLRGWTLGQRKRRYQPSTDLFGNPTKWARAFQNPEAQ